MRRGFPRVAVYTVYLLGALLVAAFFYSRVSLSSTHRLNERQLNSSTPQKSTEHGFVSSSSCRACHPSEYHTWHDSFHRTMTQYADSESVVGNFSDQEFDYFGTKISLQQRGDTFWAKVDEQWRRVVQTTGSHHYQMYWLEATDGEATDGEATDGEAKKGNRLENLPLAYLIDEKKWVRRNDIFMMPPELGSQPEGVRLWNEICIACHSTHGQPRVDVADESNSLAIDTRVGELGIACESCHGPAAEHIAYYSDPLRRYAARLSTKSDGQKIQNPAKLDSKRSSQLCGQCHSISSPHDRQDWNEHGPKFVAGDELEAKRMVLRHPAKVDLPHNRGLSQEFLDKYFWRDGMVRISGREYNGVVESPCYQRGEMSCLSCHSMHDSDPTDQLNPMMEGNSACLQCHPAIGENLEEHTHHAPNSSGSQCYNCHMPHTTYGLVKAIRSHEIDTPSVHASVSVGRPNACNLCHLDKTFEWTGKHLQDLYGIPQVALTDNQRRVAAGAYWLLAGDAGQRAIAAWHMGWEPAQKTSGTDWFVPLLAELLVDDYAVVRSLAGKAVKQLPVAQSAAGQPFEYDYIGSEEHREAVAQQVREGWKQRRKNRERASDSTLLQKPDGSLDYGAVLRLIGQRDNRPLDLLE